MSVTIRDVAAAAGVSTATVSKVINHSPTISQETVERVQEVIRQMGYRPNKRAQSFARRATKNILFLSELEHGVGFENPHLFEMLAGAEAALARKDYGLLIKRINSRELVNSFADIMDSEYVDGAIVHASVVSKEVAVLLTDTSFPYVVIGMPDFFRHIGKGRPDRIIAFHPGSGILIDFRAKQNDGQGGRGKYQEKQQDKKYVCGMLPGIFQIHDKSPFYFRAKIFTSGIRLEPMIS